MHLNFSEEIKTQAKHRTPSSKLQHSPKNRKRKHSDEQYESTGDYLLEIYYTFITINMNIFS